MAIETVRRPDADPACGACGHPWSKHYVTERGTDCAGNASHMGCDCPGWDPVAPAPPASAPTMRATLDATAVSLAEIEVAAGFLRERLATDEVCADDLTALDHIREALSALRANVEKA